MNAIKNVGYSCLLAMYACGTAQDTTKNDRNPSGSPIRDGGTTSGGNTSLEGKIAFSVYRIDRNDPVRGIHIMDADGSNVKQVVAYHGEGHTTGLSFSPDGDHLVVGKELCMFIVDLRTGIQQKIAGANCEADQYGSYYYAPNWTPDGERIVYERQYLTDTENQGRSIHSLHISGMDERVLKEGRPLGTSPSVSYYKPSLSFDGSKITFYSRTERERGAGNDSEEETFRIHTMKVDGSDERTVTETVVRESEAESNPQLYLYLSPTWHPDGRRILFRAMSHLGTDDDLERLTETWIMNEDGSGRMPLPNFPTETKVAFSGLYCDMAVSPNGQSIVIVLENPDHPRQDPDRPTSKKRTDLYVVDIADGNNRRNITNTPDRSEKCPTWR